MIYWVELQGLEEENVLREKIRIVSWKKNELNNDEEPMEWV